METKARSYKCAMYARLGDGHTADRIGEVLDKQTEAISKALIIKGASGQSSDTWEIVERYVDFTSGKSTARPALQKLKQDILSERINFVAVDTLESLARSVCDLFRIIEFFQRHNVNLYSVRDQIDTSTPIGRVQICTVLVISRLDSEARAARSVAARKNVMKELRNDQ